ncbi:MAG: diaminopimelate decarboxylase, partial [Candidatus Omnitrophota bacterium]
GIDFKTAKKIILLARGFSHVRIAGLHIHIGSQITVPEPFAAAIAKVLRFIVELRKEGIGLEYLNIGGGLGIIYDKEIPQTAAKFAGRVLPSLKKSGLKIIMEPGRFIAGNAGILVAKALYVKYTPKKKFIIVDAGMNDLIRPALYGAYHQVVSLKRKSRMERADVVGPICESGDFFAKDRLLPKVEEGDYLAALGAGAYGFSMASNYNSRRRPQEVMVVKNKVFVIRQRETYGDLVRNESIPGFLLK